ncbi:hypothetical protein [Mycobacterium sp. Aquia_213]|uniref:hypothetical protein n=1 Tax=Mycobacterium sp. Aquia_213 TaxID=2991728 RepID=UPI002270E818|nr:hypothetical protein [Mycobacterium sp. Aquia_213]WAC92256.1 hypothetical protein LMQ14_03340 [Mycobacterium sp. Aquia_213]
MTVSTEIPVGDLTKVECVAALEDATILDQHIELSEDKVVLTPEVSHASEPSAGRDRSRPLPLGMVCQLGGGHEIDLGTWDLSTCDLDVVLGMAFKAEAEFRRLLVELGVVPHDGQSQDA